jgi:hypothetical protein
MATMTPLEEFARDARTWGRQTIIFTLQHGLAGAKTAAGELAQAARTSDESAEIMNQLWAVAERGSADLRQIIRKFVRLVLEWSAGHLPAKENGQATLN